MSTWRDRLCGSEIVKPSKSDSDISLTQYLDPQPNLSCGGGHYPVNMNAANMRTFRGSFILPTDDYAVLVFRDDGSAIIYSDTEQASGEEPLDESSSFS